MQENDPVRQLNRLSCALDRTYHQAARKIGLSDSVLCILYMLHERGDGCPLHDIYSESGISKQTINSALRKLEAEQVLYLEPTGGRGKCLHLTETGKHYVETTAARLYEAERELFRSWPKEDFDRYLSLMEKHNRDLREKIPQL